MTPDGGTTQIPQQIWDRAVRLVLESGRPIAQIANDLGIHREAFRIWVRQAEADAGRRPGQLTSAERDELKRPRKETPSSIGPVRCEGRRRFRRRARPAPEE